jgi:hypothetical protein
LDNIPNTYGRNSSAGLIGTINEKPAELQGREAPFDDVGILTIKQTDQVD